MKTNCQLLSGAGAVALLSDPRFRDEWSALEGTCPWATVYQSEPFVTRWYRTFREHWEPVVAVAWHPGGGLRGLLTLARSKETRALACAGDRRAEYQAWLAAEHDATFITDALAALRKAYPRQWLCFQYLPQAAPLEWARSPDWKNHCLLDSAARPLLSAEDADRLRKKRYRKTKLEELEKLGPIEFRRLSGRAELEAVIDEIIEFYDLRQGAAHYAVPPFRADPKRRGLYLELAAVPGLLDTTILRVGGKLASACLCIRNHDEIILDVIAHAPALEKYSVGTLQIFRTAESLVHENVRHLDLTPGGAFKHRFATQYQQVHALSVSFSTARAAAQKAVRALRGVAKRCVLLCSTQ